MTTRGYRIRERDSRGWIVPKEGTLAYVVYMGMVTGDPIEHVARVIGRSDQYVRIVRHQLRHGRKRQPEWLSRLAEPAE